MRNYNLLQHISKLIAGVLNQLQIINDKLNFAGIGNYSENLCDTTNMLLVAPKYIGAIQRVYTTDATTLSGRPGAWSSGTVVAYRQVMAQWSNTLAHAVVMLYEVHPVRGRVWMNVYNTSWGGWQSYGGTNYGTLPSTANLNDYKYPSTYWVNDLSTKTNLPNGASYGYLEVVNPSNGASGGLPLQRYTEYNSRDSWHRSYVNSAWSAWKYDGGDNLKYSYFTSASASRAANSSGSVNITITVPDNYSILCYTTSWSNGNVVPSYPLATGTSTTATVWWRNPTSSALTCSFSVGVLFIRN